MGKRTDSILSLVLTLAALVVAGAVARRELSLGRSKDQARSEWHKDWQRISDVGRPLTGKSLPSAAGRGAVTLTIFSDAQCPYCRSFHAIARSELERFDGRLSVRCIHFPLASHPYALGAAQALECAFDQEALDGLIDSLFAQQDRIGEKPWTAFAAEAGVADAGAFTECLKRRTFAAIDSGLRIGRDIGVTGTPTVLLNGWKFGSPPAESTLTRAIQSVLGGHQPFKGFRLGE